MAERAAERRIDERIRTKAPVHFAGIGGVGMAGIARLLHQQGCQVSGSETVPNRLTAQLEALGIPVFAGHGPDTLPQQAEWVVRTPAVLDGNPELIAGRERGLPLYSRAEVLASLANQREGVAVAGAHGKTTTSAMITHVLRACGHRCGYAVGGETSLPGTVADTGTEPTFVFEADESDGSLISYRPAVGVLLNVEWDHVDCFADEGQLYDCFRRFVRQADVVVVCADDSPAREICAGHPSVMTAGFDGDADVRVAVSSEDAEGMRCLFHCEGCAVEGTLVLTGRHNASNAAVAVAVALRLGVDFSAAVAALSSFQPVARRFDVVQGKGRLLIGDYAHHPTEIAAFLSSVRPLHAGKLLGVFQPHRYSRTKHMLPEFAAALAPVDVLHLVPVYGASEAPIAGGTSGDLAEVAGVPAQRVHQDLTAAWEMLRDEWSEETALLVIGAGNVETVFTWAKDWILSGEDDG